MFKISASIALMFVTRDILKTAKELDRLKINGPSDQVCAPK
jgi:hypothetical protein